MKEEWRDIDGYEGLYQVSNLGRVRSLDKIIHQRTEKYGIAISARKGRILKRRIKSGGYDSVMLTKNGEAKNKLVSRLVAIHFIPNPDRKKTVNHKDFNKLNNHVSNLEWCSQKENVIHAGKAGRMSRPLSPNRKSTIKESQAASVKKLLKKGLTSKEIESRTGVSKKIIYSIKENRTWKHVEV